MKVNLVVDPQAKGMTGISKYTKSIYPPLHGKIEIELVNAKPLGLPKVVYKMGRYAGFDFDTFFKSLPISVENGFSGGIYHFTRIFLSLPMNFKKYHPSVVTVLDLGAVATTHDELLFRFKHIDKFMLKLALRSTKKADKIIAISKSTKRDIQRYLSIPKDRIRVVHLGVDHDIFKVLKGTTRKLDTFKGGNLNLLYVGNEMPRKNLSMLLRAFYKLKKSLPGVRLVKVGGHNAPEGRRRLQSLIKELGLGNDVIFTGNVPEEDLPLYYNAADLFVTPSLYEGFGLPALEAMACGTPVVASNATSLPEIVGDAGLSVNPLDVDGMADAMFRVLTDDGLRDSMIKKGLKRAKEFTWEKTAEETMKVYSEVIS